MKKTFKMMMAAVMTMAMVGFVACSKDDDKKTDEPQQQTYEASGSYAIHYMGRTLEPGQTVYHNVTEAEKEADEAVDDFHIENLRDLTLGTRFKVEFVSGPTSMNEVPVCYGQCKSVICPYTSNEFDLASGLDPIALQVHCYPRDHEAGSKGTYRITVGIGESLEDPQVFFLQFAL